MNRRALLRFFGLAPAGVPAAAVTSAIVDVDALAARLTAIEARFAASDAAAKVTVDWRNSRDWDLEPCRRAYMRALETINHGRSKHNDWVTLGEGCAVDAELRRVAVGRLGEPVVVECERFAAAPPVDEADQARRAKRRDEAERIAREAITLESELRAEEEEAERKYEERRLQREQATLRAFAKFRQSLPETSQLRLSDTDGMKPGEPGGAESGLASGVPNLLAQVVAGQSENVFAIAQGKDQTQEQRVVEMQTAGDLNVGQFAEHQAHPSSPSVGVSNPDGSRVAAGGAHHSGGGSCVSTNNQEFRPPSPLTRLRRASRPSPSPASSASPHGGTAAARSP